MDDSILMKILQEKVTYTILAFFTYLHTSLILWIIFTCNTCMKSYKHVDYTCNVIFQNVEKENSEANKVDYFSFFHIFV